MTLGLKELYMKQMVKGMTKEEKQSMMEKMMDEFFASMTSDDKKELMKQMMPKMMEKMMEEMTAEDKQELMRSMLPSMMSQMFRGEGKMSRMSMKNMMFSEKQKSQMPTMETQEDFKPWEFCPCRKLCRKAFETKTKS